MIFSWMERWYLIFTDSWTRGLFIPVTKTADLAQSTLIGTITIDLTVTLSMEVSPQ
jgi:hypothetical protein